MNLQLLKWRNVFFIPKSTTQNSQILAACFGIFMWNGFHLPHWWGIKASLVENTPTCKTLTKNAVNRHLRLFAKHARSNYVYNMSALQNACKPSDQYIQSSVHTGNIQKCKNAKVYVSCVAAICWQCRSILRSCCLKLRCAPISGQVAFWYAYSTFSVDDPKSTGIEVSAMGP